MDTQEYEFPDEKEAKLEAAAQEEKDEIEINIVDDTPEQDRGRKPAPPVDEVTEDELNQINKQSVKKRLEQLGRGLNDERRAKEAALREQQEAIKLAQMLVEENKRLKGTLSQGEQVMIDQAKQTINLEIEQAKKKLKEAYDSGDSEALLNAQQELTNASIKADKVNNFKPTPLQDPETEFKLAQRQQVPAIKPAPVDTKAQAWQQENQWFGKDEEMTGFAIALHHKLVKEGVDPRSDEYYDRLNTRVRQVFADQFADEQEQPGEQRRAKSNVVAPVSRSTATKKVTLTQTQVALAKKLGVPLELYAKQVAAERNKNV